MLTDRCPVARDQPGARAADSAAPAGDHRNLSGEVDLLIHVFARG